MMPGSRMAAWSLLLLIAVPIAAQTGGDADVLARIRDEANSRSQILRSVHVLADVYGPRLTGSPSLKAAGEWAVATMQSWGLTNGHLEPWNWGRDGWVNERFSAHIVSPVKDSLVGEVLAWTPGTNGVVTAQISPTWSPVPIASHAESPQHHASPSPSTAHIVV